MTWYNWPKALLMDPNGNSAGVTAPGEPPLTIYQDVLKICLMTSGHSFDADNDFFSDITGELSVTGYTARGDGDGAGALGSKTMTVNDTDDTGELDAADHTYPSLTAGGTITNIVLIRELDSGAADGNTMLIAHVAVASTGTNGGDITLQFHDDGLLNITD